MIGILYTAFFGFWACLICMALGLIFCATIIGLPVGLTFFALGVKVLTLK